MNNKIAPTKISGEFLPVEWITKTPPEQEFCVNPLIPIGGVTLINAHGGTGKSLFALKMTVHIALGLPIIDAETNGGNVAYMSLEDPENVVRNRIFKTIKALPEEVQSRIDELTSKLMIIDRYGLPTHMATNQDGNIVTAPIAQELCTLLKENKIKCLFIDTFIRTNTLNENDNAQMGALLVAFEGIAKEAKCGVVLIHHTPKGSGDKTNNKYAARGASAITDNARSALLMEKVPEGDVDKFSEESIKGTILDGRLIKVTHIKHNYSAQHPKHYLEMSPDGVLLEVFPGFESRDSLALRYQELYKWWLAEWNKRPLTKTNIDQNVNGIRPAGSKFGKEKYKGALDWAIKQGVAKETPAPEEGSKNPNTKYYTLLPDLSD